MDKKYEIYRAILKNCPFDGFDQNAITNAALEIGCDEFTAKRLFKNGFSDVAEIFAADLNQKMMNAINHHESFKNIGTTAKVKFCIISRIQYLNADYEPNRRVVSEMFSPKNVASSMKLCWQTADVIWKICGDKSTDFNYYSKRAILSGVYSSTLLYWLSDDSENNSETLEFLNRQLERSASLGKLIQKFKDS